jgi:hypothetical protein
MWSFLISALLMGTTYPFVISSLVCESADSQACVTIMYTAEDGVESTWTETQDVRVGLPMTVNVQDFFRPDW